MFTSRSIPPLTVARNRLTYGNLAEDFDVVNPACTVLHVRRRPMAGRWKTKTKPYHTIYVYANDTLTGNVQVITEIMHHHKLISARRQALEWHLLFWKPCGLAVDPMKYSKRKRWMWNLFWKKKPRTYRINIFENWNLKKKRKRKLSK